MNSIQRNEANQRGLQKLSSLVVLRLFYVEKYFLRQKAYYLFWSDGACIATPLPRNMVRKKKALQNTDKSDLKGGTYKNLIRDTILKVVPYAFVEVMIYDIMMKDYSAEEQVFSFSLFSFNTKYLLTK